MDHNTVGQREVQVLRQRGKLCVNLSADIPDGNIGHEPALNQKVLLGLRCRTRLIPFYYSCFPFRNINALHREDHRLFFYVINNADACCVAKVAHPDIIAAVNVVQVATVRPAIRNNAL